VQENEIVLKDNIVGISGIGKPAETKKYLTLERAPTQM
jgi:hypothetical protein